MGTLIIATHDEPPPPPPPPRGRGVGGGRGGCGVEREERCTITCRRANAAHALSIDDGFRNMATNLPISAPLRNMKTRYKKSDEERKNYEIEKHKHKYMASPSPLFPNQTTNSHTLRAEEREGERKGGREG
jgi:hypothetical protein